MPYYPTLAEDIARAKEILAKGKAGPALAAGGQHFDFPGGTIYGADIFAAYKLLESFVEAIEAMDPKVAELCLRAQRRAKEAAGDCVCRTRGCGHGAALHVGGICQACACGGWS